MHLRGTKSAEDSGKILTFGSRGKGLQSENRAANSLGCKALELHGNKLHYLIYLVCGCTSYILELS